MTAARTVRVLVVEDSALVAMMIEDTICDLGHEVVGPITRIAQALVAAKEAEVDAAILDVNLNGEFSWQVAATLHGRGIPFLMCTGYDGATVLPPELAGITIVGKPFTPQQLKRQLLALLEGTVGVTRRAAMPG
jgi:chemotaxis family two-component system sensor kinase Cph1